MPCRLARLLQRPGMPLPEDFLELITRSLACHFLSVMRLGAGEIWSGEGPEPDRLLAGQGHFHDPASRQPVNPDAVVISRSQKALATREHLAGEPVGVNLVSNGRIVHGKEKR